MPTATVPVLSHSQPPTTENPEFSTAMADLVSDLTATRAAELPGRLVRRTPTGATEIVAADLVGPTAVAVVDGRIFVSEEFAGRVREVGPPRPSRVTTSTTLLAAAAGLIAAIATAATLSRRSRRQPPLPSKGV